MKCANPKCGKEFKPMVYNVKFCCRDCNIFYFNNRTKIQNGTLDRIFQRRCRHCSVAFTTKFKDQISCSARCRASYSQNKIRKEDRMLSMIGKQFKCPVCKKDFVPVRRRNQTCCSDSCSKEHYKLRTKTRTEVKFCAKCGKPFDPQKTSKIYCSDKCKNRSMHARVSPEKRKEWSSKYKPSKETLEKHRIRNLQHRKDNAFKVSVYAMRKHHDNIINLKDTYVGALIIQKTKLTREDIPQDLIEVKREYIKIKRLLKQLQTT